MPSSIPLWVVDKIFPNLSALSPKLLKLQPKRRQASASFEAPAAESHSPTLPSEVLQAILPPATQQSGPDIDLAEKIELRATILACAQVCQLWRHAARGYSPLWTHAIDFQRHPPQVVRDLVQLSKPHMIDVGHRSAPFCITRGRDFIVLNLLKDDCRRIREWNLEIIEAYRPLNYCRWIFGVPDAIGSRPVGTLRLTGSVVSPSGALQGLTTHLKKLCLTETNLNLSTYMDLSKLTELSVSSSTLPSAKYRIMEWLALLRGMPRLQFLALKDAIKPGPELDPIAANQPVKSVVLRELRLLSLSESTWDSAYALLVLLRGPTIQKPRSCGLDLTLPSTADLPGSGITHQQVIIVLTLVSFSLLPHPLQLTTAPAPRTEIGLKPYRSGFQLTLGTVHDHERTLDWNGGRGGDGVKRYLDEYFKCSTSTPRRPPLSVSVRNPTLQDFNNICILANPLLSTAKSLGITIDPRLCQSPDVYPILDAIPGVLTRMSEVDAVTLNDGALVSLLPILQGRTYMSGLIPIPVLPNLQYLAIEGAASEVGEVGPYHGVSGVGMLSILRQYADWRKSVGLPVDVVGCSAGKMEDDGVGERWKRQGMVAMPL